MNQSLESILQILFAVFCIIFGLDKFLEFLPTCSLISDIPQSGMIATGVIEIIIGIALLLKKYTLTSLRVATAIMIGGLGFRLFKGTYDLGAAAFGSILGLVLIVLHKKRNP